MDYTGSGTLWVETDPTGATVTYVLGSGSEQTLDADGKITLSGVADNTPLTITAGKEGYTFSDFKLTLRRAAPTVESVTISGQADPAISNSALTLDADYAKEYQLTACAWTGADGQGTAISGKTFTWSSDDTAKEVIELSEDGKLTVKGPGEAKVTATCGDKSAELTVKVERVKAEVKVYKDATMETPVTDSVTFSATGDKALYVDPVLKNSITGVHVEKWTVTLGTTTLDVGAGNKIDLSSAENGQKLTIKAEHANYNFGEDVVLTINVEAAAGEWYVYGLVGGSNTRLYDGGSFELDAKGAASLAVSTNATSASVLAKLSGSGNVSFNIPRTNIYVSNATNGDVLTITATAKGYKFEPFTLNLTQAEAKNNAELQAYMSADFAGTPVASSVGLDAAGNGVLYVRAVDKDTTTKVPDAKLTASINSGTADLDQATGCVTISGASDNSVLKISSTTPDGYNTIQPLTITLTRPAAPTITVNDVYVWLTADESENTVHELQMILGDSANLTAFVNTDEGVNNGVTWSSDKPSVVSVSGTAYAATLTAKAVGTATITVTSKDDTSKKHEIEVTVKEAVNLSFTPHAGVYNKDLWVLGLADLARARFARMIGTVPTGTDLTQFTTISIKNSSGEFVVEEEPSTNYLTDVSYSVEDWAEQLQGAGLLDADLLPVCFMNYVMPGFELGEYDITLTTLSGQEFTTSINIVDNDFYEDASWTTGSSEGLLIAKMPGITNDLLVKFVSGLKISKDGTQLLKDQGNTDILEVDAETGNVYIKKAILDTLEVGTYSIGFTVVGNEELLNFTVVAAAPAPAPAPAPDSEVRTLSTDVTISVGGVARKQNIMVRDIYNILSDDTQLYVDVASEAHDELDTPIFDVEHGFHYNIKLLDAAGNELPMPLSAKVELLFECVEGLDVGQLEIVLADSLTDTQFEEDYQTYGDVQYVGVLTNHFSPYSLFDIQTEDEKAALGKGKNNKTGDQAVQIAVAGLGSILVLALGIMLRLITRKKKFEE